MKSYLLKSVAFVALTATSFVASPETSFAQSKDDAIQRLEARLDALAQENAALRDRVKQIESGRPAAPVRVASLGGKTPGVTASDARPEAPIAAARAARAADLPVKAVPLAPSNCAAQRWQGGYGGLNGGGVNLAANRTDQDAFLLTTSSTFVQKKWGYEVGGQVGYNWVSCNTLWGVEVDGAWAHVDVDTRAAPSAAGFFLNVSSRLDGVVTARARTGIALDKLLFYVTGGVAAVHTHTFWTQATSFGGTTFRAVDEQNWRVGWVGGFGTEWAWTDRLSLKSEVLYVDVADHSYSRSFGAAGGLPAGTFTLTNSDSMWISRVGLNYRFGG